LTWIAGFAKRGFHDDAIAYVTDIFRAQSLRTIFIFIATIPAEAGPAVAVHTVRIQVFGEITLCGRPTGTGPHAAVGGDSNAIESLHAVVCGCVDVSVRTRIAELGVPYGIRDTVAGVVHIQRFVSCRTVSIRIAPSSAEAVSTDTFHAVGVVDIRNTCALGCRASWAISGIIFSQARVTRWAEIVFGVEVAKRTWITDVRTV